MPSCFYFYFLVLFLFNLKLLLRVRQGFEYSRTDNPTRRAFEANVAACENARYGDLSLSLLPRSPFFFFFFFFFFFARTRVPEGERYLFLISWHRRLRGCPPPNTLYLQASALRRAARPP